jgi:prepilin signal peptidase PulO-like enzyme (type II secretory pathway)
MNIFTEAVTYVPMPILFIFAFILGIIVGSFLNVVILRHDTPEDLGGRSHCTKCDYSLSWYDLIPVISWLTLKGKCRKCTKKISIQYPLVEFATGLMFVALFNFAFQYTFYPTIGAIIFTWNAVIFSVLICIFVYDLKHKIIPNRWSYLFAGLALIQTLWLLPISENLSSVFTEPEIVFNLLAGPILFLPFFLLWFASGGRWIGLGDGKLVIGIGWFLGFVNGLSAITLAFWIGAVYSLGLIFTERVLLKNSKINLKTEIPFGPFLIIGLLIQFFFPVDVIGISYLFIQ